MALTLMLRPFRMGLDLTDTFLCNFKAISFCPSQLSTPAIGHLALKSQNPKSQSRHGTTSTP